MVVRHLTNEERVMMMKKTVLMFGLAGLLFSSCSKDEPKVENKTELAAENGTLITINASGSSSRAIFDVTGDVPTPVWDDFSMCSEVYIRKEGSSNVYKLKHLVYWDAKGVDAAGGLMQLLPKPYNAAADATPWAGELNPAYKAISGVESASGWEVETVSGSGDMPRPLAGEKWYVAGISVKPGTYTSINGKVTLDQEGERVFYPDQNGRIAQSRFQLANWRTVKVQEDGKLNLHLDFEPIGYFLRLNIVNKTGEAFDEESFRSPDGRSTFFKIHSKSKALEGFIDFTKDISAGMQWELSNPDRRGTGVEIHFAGLPTDGRPLRELPDNGTSTVYVQFLYPFDMEDNVEFLFPKFDFSVTIPESNMQNKQNYRYWGGVAVGDMNLERGKIYTLTVELNPVS